MKTEELEAQREKGERTVTELCYSRASTMETPIFGYLNGSHVYTSLIYNFLIEVPNKHSISPTQYLTQINYQ